MMFRDSPVKFRSTTSSFNGLAELKPMNSTTSSFAKSKNSHLSMRSNASFTSAKNTQGKLSNLRQQLTEISQDISSMRAATKDASMYVRFMGEDLRDRQLPQIQDELIYQIQALKKSINIGGRSDNLRYESIKNNLSQLQKSTRNIKGQLQQLNSRMNNIENTLGYYSGCQKHKY